MQLDSCTIPIGGSQQINHASLIGQRYMLCAWDFWLGFSILESVVFRAVLTSMKFYGSSAVALPPLHSDCSVLSAGLSVWKKNI